MKTQRGLAVDPMESDLYGIKGGRRRTTPGSVFRLARSIIPILVLLQAEVDDDETFSHLEVGSGFGRKHVEEAHDGGSNDHHHISIETMNDHE